MVNDVFLQYYLNHSDFQGKSYFTAIRYFFLSIALRVPPSYLEGFKRAKKNLNLRVIYRIKTEKHAVTLGSHPSLLKIWIFDFVMIMCSEFLNDCKASSQFAYLKCN